MKAVFYLRFISALLLAPWFAFSVSSEPSQLTTKSMDMPAPSLQMDFQPLEFGEKDTLLLNVHVGIPAGWHVNSHAPLDSFSVPTRLDLSGEGLAFGTPVFSEPISKFIQALGSQVSLFENEFQISVPVWQKSRTSAYDLASTTATLKYQACNDAVCLPPRILSAMYPGVSVSTSPPSASSALFSPKQPQQAAGEAFSTPSATAKTGTSESGVDFSRGFLVVFLGLLVSGIALNLTPCVYPMVAITISLFGAQQGRSGSYRAFMAVCYVLGIVITFSSLGLLAAFSGNLFGSILQSSLAQAVIVGTFLVLALGLFGAYDIRMPSGLMGAAMAASNAGGYLGGLLAGLFAGVLASPCIGPIILALLIYVAERGSAWTGLWMFGTLALGMGIPYLILGASSTLMDRLPRSGQWMVDVKKILGVVLLILANYYARGFLEPMVYQFILGALILYIGLYINPFAKIDTVERSLAALLRTLAFLAILAGTYEIGKAFPAFHPPQASAQAVLGVDSKEQGPLPWVDFSEVEIDKARNAGQWTLIDFQSKIWCAACRAMEDKTFSNPSVRRRLEELTLLTVDVDKHPEAENLKARFKIWGIPTIILLDPNGKEVHRMVGFVPAGDFLRRLGDYMKASAVILGTTGNI